MKSTNFQMDLMTPNQPNKDVIFNESLLTIDSFLGNSINGMLAEIPDDLAVGAKYIITDGEHRNKICFRSHPSRGVDLFEPQDGTLFFLLETQNFVLYHNENWEQINQRAAAEQAAQTPPPPAPEPAGISRAALNDLQFTNTGREFRATENKPFYYLYVNDHSALLFDRLTEPEITIILKQAHNATHQIVWQYSVIWEQRAPHFLSETPNAMDIVKLYKLPDGNHFLGKTIAANIQF